MIKVFIPTYKRLNSLPWVLYSLVKTKPVTSGIETICYIVNNYPDNKNEVELIVNNLKITYNNNWKFIVVHRESTLPPINNWYSAIDEYSDIGDVIFLHGDDDLFLPNSITDRVELILKENADLLLTTHLSSLKFLPDNKILMPLSELGYNKGNNNYQEIGLADEKWSSIFIANNTYRYTKELKNAIKKSFEWCHQQDWLNYDNRTLMLPFYVPLALMIDEGKVIRQNLSYVIRGGNREEIYKAMWGVPGWNSGFLQLATRGVLNNAELGKYNQLDNDREVCDKFIYRWYYTFFLDKRISTTIRKLTFQRVGKPQMTFGRKLGALKFILFDYVYRRTHIIQLKNYLMNKDPIDIKSFIDALSKDE